MTFTEADREYRRAIEAYGSEMNSAVDAARKVTEVRLQDLDLTFAVLLRLKSFFEAQKEIKRILDKVYAAPAADFFVETVCFFLKMAFEKLDKSIHISSEKKILKKRGAIRPDITIWRGEKLIAAIECKTQLGWNRKGWKEDFERRERILKKSHQGAKLFLLVMTGSNWAGFEEDPRVGKQFFLLLDKIWPVDYSVSEESNKLIVNPIESIVELLIDCNV